MKNYNEVIEKLIKKNIIGKNEFFDFENADLANEFEKYFDYCQTELEFYSLKYHISPAFIYFSLHFDVNARATLTQGVFLIEINMGTIQETYNKFYKNNLIFEQHISLSVGFKDLSTKIGVPINYLMFQLSTLFTFHHEAAHLVQFSYNDEKNFSEQYEQQSKNEFNFRNHILEYDADMHGASAVCSYVLEHFNRLQFKNQTKKNLLLLLSIGITSIFLYLLIYLDSTTKIYYRKFSHPHPLIRISYVIDCVMEVAKNNLPMKVSINKEKLMKLSFMIAEIYTQTQPNSNDLIQIFKESLLAKFESIEQYANEIVEHSIKMDNLIINRA